MKTKDFICGCVFNIPSDFIDELCDEYDLDFTDDDVKEIINMCAGDLFHGDNLGSVGNELIRELYGQIISKYKDDLDEEKFDYFLNGDDSKLYYDEEQVYSKEWLDTLVEQKEMENA